MDTQTKLYDILDLDPSPFHILYTQNRQTISKHKINTCTYKHSFTIGYIITMTDYAWKILGTDFKCIEHNVGINAHEQVFYGNITKISNIQQTFKL